MLETVHRVASNFKEEAYQMIVSQKGALFALLDAARGDRVLEILKTCEEEHRSLYEGDQGDELADVAPYLVRLRRDSLLLETLVFEGWGNSWGIYLTCNLPFLEVRRHLRYFLMVKDEAGQRLFFRFYDPRVLRVFLPTCTPGELGEFFGPVGSIVMEEDDPPRIVTYRHTLGILMRETTPAVVSVPVEA